LSHGIVRASGAKNFGGQFSHTGMPSTAAWLMDGKQHVIANATTAKATK
jgi:hypothetical protein